MIIAVNKIRRAAQRRINAFPHQQDSPISLRQFVALLDSAEKLDIPQPAPAPKPEFPREIYTRYSARPRTVTSQEQLEKLLKHGYVETLAECDHWPLILWLEKDNPNWRQVWNRYEFTEASKEGWAPDPTRRNPVTYSRRNDPTGTYRQFLLTCDDRALLAYVQLEYQKRAGHSEPSDWTAHLTDVLSAYYYPDPDEGQIK